MDHLMIPDKQKSFICKFAAPSVLTGRFVAYIYCMDADEIRDALTNPGTLVVENEHVGVREYPGYTTVYSMDKQPDGYIVKLSKDGSDNGQ